MAHMDARWLLLGLVIVSASGCTVRQQLISGGPAYCVPNSVELYFFEPGVYASLANGNATSRDTDTRLPFDTSVMPFNESGAVLERVTWSSGVSMTNAMITRSGDVAQLSFDVVSGTMNETLQTWSRELLANLTGESGNVLQSSVDALLRNSTVGEQGRNPATQQLEPLFMTYRMTLPWPTTFSAIFANGTHRESMPIEMGRSGIGLPGDLTVYSENWVFEFHLPLRQVTTPEGNLTVLLTADQRDHAAAHVNGTTSLAVATNATRETLAGFGLALPLLGPENVGPLCPASSP